MPHTPRSSRLRLALVLFVSATIGMLLAGLFAVRQLTAAVNFTAGNLAILVAPASASNTTGSVVEIDPTIPNQTGSAVQSIAIPGTGTDAYRLSGSATSTGYVSASNNRTLLTFTGANVTGDIATNVNALNPRGVFTLNHAGAIVKQTTYTGSSGNQTRSATSLDNAAWYIADQGGLFTNGSSGASPTGNFRAAKSFGGAVYLSQASGTAANIQVVTVPAPTGGSTAGLPGLTNNANLQDYYLVQSGDHGSVYDILYILSATSNTAGTIAKYSLADANANGILGDAGDSWTANGAYPTAFGGFGLAAADAGSGEVLYVSTGQGALTANRVLKVADDAGYNATINVTTANNVTLYTAAAGAIIKGLDFAPLSTTPTVSLSVSTNTASEAAQTAVTVTATASLAVSSDQTLILGVSGTNLTADDYTLSSTTITIPSGQTTGSATFTVADDLLVEGPETATLTISSPASGLTLGSPITQNITIVDNDGSVLPAVSLSISTTSASEAATTAITVTATASSAVSGAQTMSLGVSGTSVTSDDYTLSGTTITIPNGQTTSSVTFTVVDDGLAEGTETAILTISNPSAGIALGSPITRSITIEDNDGPAVCSAAHVAINLVQGSGNASAYVAQTVTVRGVVVGDYEGPAPALRGFYLQDLPADDDNNAATSEGIFVFETNSANSVSVGQVVQVTGTVSEFNGLTELSSSNIANCGTTSTATPIDVTLPVPAAVAGVPYLERFEGMLVRFHQTLYVTEQFQLGQFGQILMSAGGRLPQPTNVVAPGAQAIALQAANALNSIVVDDELNGQDPDPIKFGRGGNPLSALNTLRGGDTATDIVGVVTFDFAEYHLRPINALVNGVNGVAPDFQASNPRPAAPPSVGGRLKAAGMNVLNYFLTLDNGTSICGPTSAKQQCRGAETAVELTRQQQKLNQALIKVNADIFGFSELENTQAVASGLDVNPLADIVDRLNTSLGSSVYSYIDTGVIGTDTIRVGIAYKKASVTPVGSLLVDDNPVHNRPPVAQLFAENATGERFSVVVNHFKSKGSCPASGADADQGDGQGCWNAVRTQQATALVSFVNTVVTTTSDRDVLLLGDFNSYAKEDPIRTLETAGFTNLVARYSGASAYSYVFDGQWGYLDHGLASASLLPQVTSAGDYHINADEPSVLDYNTNFKSAGQVATLFNADEFRIADHDPVLIGLALAPSPLANADMFTVEAGTTLTVNGAGGLLANDAGGPLSILGHTSTAHGTLTLNADGSFSYTPTPGYTGPDTFNYAVSNAARRYNLQVARTALPPLAAIGGVNITAGAFGSALVPVPNDPGAFYGLTDRGPNVDGPSGTKIEPVPTFVPSIGKFRLVGSQAILEGTIPLGASDGTPYSGRVSSVATTGETITDLNGNELPVDPNGYDPEGLVALPDGTFWVSDEYGPFITHFDAAGKQDARLSPFDGSLPVELKNRIVNRGMEGLTITPNGSMLVGIMQSALQQADLSGFDAKKLTPLRIVTYTLATSQLREYLYLLDDPNTTKTAVSEITALSDTLFLVDERDANYPPGAYKKLYLIDISAATDVGPNSGLAGYDGSAGGLLVGGKTIENLLRNGSNPLDTSTSASTLAANGISPVSKTLYVDVGALLDGIDPQGRVFSHDKLEGVAALNGGATLVISNDSDFGIDGVVSGPPFQLHAKVSPVTGQQDDGEFLVIDLIRSTAAVTIDVKDTTRPQTSLTSMPSNPTSSTVAGFVISGSDGGGSGVTGFECRLDAEAFASCSSGVVYSVADGAHTLAVRALDGAGNVDDTPATYTWTVDTIPPETTIDSGPANSTGSTTASFTFHGTDAGTGVARLECAIDGAAFSACSSGASYGGLAIGGHVLEVRAVDAAGNVDATPASYSWTIGKATAIVTLGNLTQTYTGGSLIPTATTAPPGLAIVWTNAPQTNAGGYAVTATVSNPDYQGAASGSFVIQKASAIIAFGPTPTPTYPGSFTVVASTTNTDGAALTYRVVSGPCALVSGATFNASAAGTCRVQASGAASLNFLAVSAQQDVVVTAPAIAINNIPAAPVFGDSFGPTYTYAGIGKTSTRSSTEGICTVSGKGTVKFVGVGTCTLTAHAAAKKRSQEETGPAQSFVVGPASTSVAVKNVPAGKNAKAGGSFTPTYKYAGDGVPSVTSNTLTTCSVSGNVVHFAKSGTCTLTASATAGINFAASVGTPQSFAIK